MAPCHDKLNLSACAVSGPPRYFEIYNSSFQFSCHVKLIVARCHVSRTPPETWGDTNVKYIYLQCTTAPSILYEQTVPYQFFWYVPKKFLVQGPFQLSVRSSVPSRCLCAVMAHENERIARENEKNEAAMLKSYECFSAIFCYLP